MISVTIDGVAREARVGERLIDVLNRTGSKVPQVCYHPQLGPIQTCDTCMVELDGQLLITRRATFFVMFGLQVLLFWFLPTVTAVSLLTIVTFVVLMCYGGGFGTMPAFAADYFGSKNVGPIYGLMLTAWGCASAVGPLLIAYMRQTTGSYRGALHIIAGVMAISALLPILVSRPGGGIVDSRGRTERRGPDLTSSVRQH